MVRKDGKGVLGVREGEVGGGGGGRGAYVH